MDIPPFHEFAILPEPSPGDAKLNAGRWAIYRFNAKGKLEITQRGFATRQAAAEAALAMWEQTGQDKTLTLHMPVKNEKADHS